VKTFPDFTQLAYQPPVAKKSFASWKAQVERETGRPLDEWIWHTMEQIAVRPLYT